MEDVTLLSLVGVISAVAGIVLGFVVKGISSAKHTALEKKVSFLEADANDGDKIKAAMEAFKSSPEFKAMQELEYRKGWETGQAETLGKFQIQYEKFSNREEKWFGIVTVIETGYWMQLFFNGLPIGDVTKRTLFAEKKVDKEVVREVLNRLDATINNLINTAKNSQIDAKEVKGLNRK